MAPTRSRASDPPAGFTYHAELLNADEEAAFIDLLEALPWEPFRFRGVEARRRVVHFGHRYDFEARGVAPGHPMPPALLRLRARVAPLADRPAERFEEGLATEYRPGATIGWHRDAPAFGSTVIGVSLGAACRFRFRRAVEGGWESWERTVEPRSVYVLGGSARAVWQHSIPPTDALRYSITFRTIRSRSSA
jgi:alkylated DNA repair protein (DNA oxidative demethylase)